MKKVSVIVPVYGVEKYIEKCARSIFEQTYLDLDIIFVDDCSPDHSIQIIIDVLHEYPGRQNEVRIIAHSQNLGLAGSRATGLLASQGDYLLQVDSDDFISPYTVERLVAKAEQENADIVVCDICEVYGNQSKNLHCEPDFNPQRSMMKILKGTLHGSVCNKLFRRDLYFLHHILPTQGLNMREDLSVTYKLFYFAKKIAYVAEPFYNYVQRDGSYCSVARSERNQLDSMQLIIQMNNFCQEESVQDAELLASFKYFKASIYSFCFLYWNQKLIDESLFKGIQVKHFIFHPTLPIHCKIAGLCAFLHLYPIVNVLRKLAGMLINEPK